MSNASTTTATKSKVYNVRPITSPILSGWKLDAAATLARSICGSTLIEALKTRNDTACVRRLAMELMHVPPLYFPVPNKSNSNSNNNNNSNKTLETATEQQVPFDVGPLWKNKENVKAHTPSVDEDGFAYDSIADYVQAYNHGDVTPVQVVKAYLEIVQESDALEPPLRAIIALEAEQVEQMLQDARASTQRYVNGESKGPLDGILVAVKDGCDVRGYETGKGTSFIGALGGKAKSDDRIVQLLRDSGAIIAGKTNMHEIGMGTTGFNMHTGTPRNPYDPQRYTGGSSSGSAAAVAAGLVPFAVAVDGGGSIRIPAALCGVVGLKATFKRVATHFDTCPSVGHAGPIATNVLDAAIAYAVMAGPAPGDAMSQQQPPPHANSLTQPSTDLKGLRIGIFPDHFEDAADEIVKDCRRVVQQMKDLGAEVVNVTIPNMKELNMAHSITILTEMGQFVDRYYHRVDEFSPEIQLTLEVGRSLSSRDFLAAQRVRGYFMKIVEEMFETIDVYVSPATGMVAPKIAPGTEARGESNLNRTMSLMRYMLMGNMVGIPGLAFPVGYTSEGLPTSMLIQSAHWNEDVLFRIASAVESPRMRPKVHYSVLERAKEQSA